MSEYPQSEEYRPDDSVAGDCLGGFVDDSGATLELICGICGFRGTPIVAGAHDCAALSDEGGDDG